MERQVMLIWEWVVKLYKEDEDEKE